LRKEGKKEGTLQAHLCSHIFGEGRGKKNLRGGIEKARRFAAIGSKGEKGREGGVSVFSTLGPQKHKNKKKKKKIRRTSSKGKRHTSLCRYRKSNRGPIPSGEVEKGGCATRIPTSRRVKRGVKRPALQFPEKGESPTYE